VILDLIDEFVSDFGKIYGRSPPPNDPFYGDVSNAYD
jgi:hypothetical protein